MTLVEYKPIMKLWILLVCLCGYASGVDVTVEVGLSATLVCPLPGTFPEWIGPDQTALTSNNEVTAVGMEYANDKDLRILAVTATHAGEYRCRSNSGEGVVKLIVQSFAYHVELQGVRDHIVPYYPNTRVIAADVDKDYELVCVVSNALPEPQITITMPDTTLTINPTTESTMETNKTYTVTAKANISVTWALDNKQVICKAASGDKSVETTETLRVLYMPLLYIYSSSGDLYAAKTSGVYECESILAWPLVDYVWSYNGEPISGYFKKNETKCVQDSRNLRYNCTSVVSADLSKENNGGTVSCKLVFLGTTTTSGHDFRISYLFPPTSATIEPMATITAKEGDNVTLTCSTDSANVFKGDNTYESGVIFKWKVGTEYLDVAVVSQSDTQGNYNGFNATQTASFEVMKSMNGHKVVCEARHSYLGINEHVSAMSEAMDISFKPVLGMLPASHRVYIGNNLNITCTAESNPDATVVWSFNGGDLQGTSGNVANSVTYSMAPVTAQAGGVYTCTATNTMFPPTTGQTEIIVFQKPPVPNLSVQLDGRNMIKVTISKSATIPSAPRWYYVQYEAASNGEWHEVSNGIQDLADGVVEVPLDNLLPGTTYRVRIRIEENGLSSYSGALRLMTDEQEETKTDNEFRNAILISVFVTFGVMLLVIGIIVYCMKSKACGSSTTGKAEFVSM